MRKIIYIAPLTALVFGGFVSEASAQATATATFEVQAINEVSVSGNPGDLIIGTAAQMQSGVTDNSTTWAVTTNQTGAKITGAIDQAMPTDVTLSVALAAPAGATAVAPALTVAAQDLVTGITTLDASGLGVTYTLQAAPTAGVVASATRTVTYTIVAGT